MFDKINNYLLLHHPLLWNIRIVPVTIIMLIVHLIYFGIGYNNGVINFTETGYGLYNNDNTGIIIFFGVLISVFVFIGWMAFYFRNNAYKSYYPQGHLSLYKEWLLILLVCLINSTYTASYYYAYNLRERSYFSEQEFSNRIDVISMASVFIEGSFVSGPKFKIDANGRRVEDPESYITYNKKDYAFTSLLNKKLTGFTYQPRKKDSINELRVKNWLTENRKDSVLWLMTQFDRIAKSHNLKSNITPQQWLNLTYNYPDFTKYTIIGKIEKYVNDDAYNYDNYDYEYPEKKALPATTTTKNISGVNYTVPNYYVPLLQLTSNYKKISGSWVSPDPDREGLLFYIYFSFAASLAIFSFRVTSGRSWLIALVGVGLTGLVTGAFTLVASSQNGFQVLWMVVITGLAIYFITIISTGTSKGLSAVAINALLWLSPYFILLLLLLLTSIYRHEHFYKDLPDNGFYKWVQENYNIITIVNLVLIIAYMYLLTSSIKKWKGLPEA